MSILNKLLPAKQQNVAGPVGELIARVSQDISGNASFKSDKIGSLVISTESLTADERAVVDSSVTGIQNTLDSIVQGFGKELSIESYQLEAATMAGAVATNPAAFLETKLRSVNTDAVQVAAVTNDGHMTRQISTEAFDERANRNAQMHSIVYNLLASRQDEFGETFFPTIVINPAEVGLQLTINMFIVYNDFKRSVKGAMVDQGRKNIIRAYADASILRNELTRAVPVLRDNGDPDVDNTEFFAADAGEWEEDVGMGIVVPTGALKVGQTVDLIGISQTNEMLNSGLAGPTDNLDAAIKLKKLFLKVGSDVIILDTENIPTSVFTAAVQGNSRSMILNFDTDGIVLNKNAVTVDPNGLATLTDLATQDARISISLSGKVNLNTGEALVNAGSIALNTLRIAATGELASTAQFEDMVTALEDAEIIGYVLDTHRANSNIAQRGQLVDSVSDYRVIQVPYRSPMATLAPVMNINEKEGTKLQSLISATGIRTSNEAVSTLIKIKDGLKSYVAMPNANGDLPEMSSIGHYFVKPVFFSDEIDLEDTVDSLTSSDRYQDLRASLVEQIRYYANMMMLESEYKAASAVLTGNQAFRPTVIVGTDSVLANYLQADGDLRTLGDNFDVRIVSTLDTRVKGQLFITFGVFDTSVNNAINPLNFGNMLYAPELVTNLPVSRDGRVSNELIVTPRFYHVNSLPVMTHITVTGIEKVIGKVEIHTKP